MHLVGARQRRFIFQPSEAAEGNREGWLMGEPVGASFERLPWVAMGNAPTPKGLNLMNGGPFSENRFNPFRVERVVCKTQGSSLLATLG